MAIKKNKKLNLIYLFLFLIAFLFCLLTFFLKNKPRNWQFLLDSKITWYTIPKADYGAFSFDQKNIYASDLSGRTYALDKKTGKEKWRFKTNFFPIYPTFDSELIYLTDFDGRTYALDKKTGKEKWRFTTPNLIKADTEPILSENLLYFGSRNGIFYALDKKTGEKKWEFKTKSINNNQFVPGKTIIHFGQFNIDEENVYINSSTDNAIYALDKKTGKEQWRFESYKYVHAKPILGKHVVIFKSKAGYLYILDKKNGRIMWQWEMKEENREDVLVKDNYIYYKSAENNLYKLNGQTQEKEWKHHNNESLQNEFIVEEEKVYLTTIAPGQGGKIVVLNDQTGQISWQFETKTLVNSNIKLDDKLVYLVSNGDLYVLSKESGEEKWHFNTPGTSGFVFPVRNGLYLASIDDGNKAIIYFLDKNTGQEKWRLETNKIAANTLVENNGNLYFLTQDLKSIISLTSKNRNKVFGLNDVFEIKSSVFKKKALNLFQKTKNFFKQKRKIKVVAETDKIKNFDVYELTINHDDSLYNNVWEDIDVSVKFKDENNNTFLTKGFYYDKNVWKVRFSPISSGKWNWKLTFKSPFLKKIKKGSFIAEKGSNQGFVRINPKNPFRFIFDNNDLFTPIGLQDCFKDNNHTGDVLNQLGIGVGKMPPEKGKTVTLSDLESYIDEYGPKGAGFNLFRFNVDNCSEKLWKEIDPNNNFYGINEGIRGDKLVQALKKNNFRIWMSLFSFELPLEGSIEDKSYQKAIKNYIDYVTARYATYIDIWELTNEISLDEKWIKFAAKYLKSVDPYNHLITTNWERPDLPEIEINSIHWYDRELALESDLITANKIDQAKKWGKPVVFSEQGNSEINWDENSALRMRLRLWTSFFKEAVIIFWNTSMGIYEHDDGCANIYLGPQERQYVRALQDFVKEIDPDIIPEKLKIGENSIRAFGLKSDKYFLAYLHHGQSHLESIQDTISLDLATNGVLEWVDPASGEILARRKVNAGHNLITTPLFKIDLAMKIRFD